MIDERLKARLRALLSKTVDNGCTEAEAMAAAAKAAEIMQEYAISEGDLHVSTATAGRATRRSTLREALYSTISIVTNCAGYYCDHVASGDPIVIYFGHDPGPTIAAYLRNVCDRAIDREIKIFKKSTFYLRRRNTSTRRQAVADFTQGMVARLNQKLQKLFAGSKDAAKRDAAAKARDLQFPGGKLIVAPKKKERFSDASFEGFRAGSNVDLHHGVDGAEAPLLIGGRS